MARPARAPRCWRACWAPYNPIITRAAIRAVDTGGKRRARGGPFRYVDTVGAAKVVELLEGFEKKLGNRVAPAPILRTLAKSGGTFYGDKKARASIGAYNPKAVGITASA